MFCQYCGKPVSDEDNFCMNCGSKLNNLDNAAEYYNQGYLYYSGDEGYPVDYNKAFFYFKKAADMGHLEAINYIGLIYLEGNGTPQNTSLAIQWFNYALKINPGFGRAHYNLGRIYYEGLGVGINYDLAYNYFSHAIDCGKGTSYYGYACHFIGYILYEVKKRPSESVYFFIEAINKEPDLADAWNNLGLLCELGYFTPSDNTTAIYYYERAACLGSVESMEAVGKLYLKLALSTTGYKREEAKENAAKWLQMAADAGSKSARLGLFSAKVSWPSDTAPNSTYDYIQPDSYNRDIQPDNSKEFNFIDGKGNYCVSGSVFYDFRGNLCTWGSPFYDSRGNLCEWGGTFYDGRGNICEWGNPFYDAQGNYIVPN